MNSSLKRKPHWLASLLIAAAAGGVIYHIGHGFAQEPRVPAKKNGRPVSGEGTAARVRVSVVKPRGGGLARTTTQPGTMESFDYADLFAKISGYVKVQPVDIGDRVRTGQVLVEIDAPEFEHELKEAEAAVAQAEAVVNQMEARVTTARADYDAALANIKLSEAELVKAKSYLKFREIQFQRISALYTKNAIEERRVDETEAQRDAAQSAQNSAEAAITSANSQAIAAKARIASAEADVRDAEAKVRLARAKVGKAQVFVDFTKIISPYDGVITRRSFHVGDFIRAADQGGSIPLLTVARTDLIRVIVQVPERDVPYMNLDDPAIVDVDVLAGEKFPGKVARTANSEDHVTKTMRTEIDLKNPKNRLRDGMFCRVTIQMQAGGKGLTLPSSSVFTDPKAKKPAVFVVRNGRASIKPVVVGQDDGAQIEILSGLTPDDQVIRHPPRELIDGAEVDAELSAEATARTAAPQ
jgi:RND family efflux transporter MFP subunit